MDIKKKLRELLSQLAVSLIAALSSIAITEIKEKAGDKNK